MALNKSYIKNTRQKSKRFLKPKLAKTGGVRKYQSGGGQGSMYNQNVIPAGIGSSTSIVYDESNPAILKAHREALEQAKRDEMASSERMSQEIESEDERAKAEQQQAANESLQKSQQVQSTVGTIGEAYGQFQKGEDVDELQKLKEEELRQESQPQTQPKVPSVVPGVQAPMEMDTMGVISKKFGEGSEAWNSMMTEKYGKDIFTKTVDTAAIPELGSGMSTGLQEGQNLSNLIDVGDQASSWAWDAGGDQASQILQQKAIEEGTSTVATEGGKELVKASTAFNPSAQVVGGAGVGSGIGKFATSGAGLGMIASGVGMGISALSDDDDPTKNTFGEMSGSVLSGAGTGASYGSMIGPVGTAIGAVAGGIYGGVSKALSAKKAREKKREWEAERKKKVDKYNKELTENIIGQKARARSAELESKTYSGYDLGRNVTYRGGGMRAIPQYI